ncbi:rho guanine nucleotide exchange factor 28 isoform X2 [Neodiprion virginianus]|uniref:rho guanine nucleotide exchange factor 28 isoform X2 n=1 Tax=Neodiprion virginianus TaxID=2961670 RepID=UPI001EE70039|nr:rho guanine nucleotide exchange factor 28 isoform X2 [Neodiprion virginianus]
MFAKKQWKLKRVFNATQCFLKLQKTDECPNSGEDSDEDVITDYLSSANPNNSRVARGTDDELDGLTLDGGASESEYTKDGSSVIVMSDRGLDQLKQQPGGIGAQLRSTGPLVPIISVTPHSPGFAKHYPVLDDNLRQLHEIHESIQRMRDLTLTTTGHNARSRLHRHHTQRLSSSCPSLCPLNPVPLRTHEHQDTSSDPDLLVDGSANSSPTHFPSSNRHLPHGSQGVDRRRSWTDLEDSRRGSRHSGQDHHLHLQARTMDETNVLNDFSFQRQRSISLSSLESELDLDLDSKPHPTGTVPGSKASRSQASTHSLNEADLIQGDFQKIVAKRERLGESGGLMPGITGSRLPLQKSISTPSIVTPPVHTHLTDSGTRTTPLLTAILHGPGRHDRGSGSETETEDLIPQRSHGFHGDLAREGTPNAQASFDELLTDGVVDDDNHSEKTRRKRGSLFFRKKKDKSGKKANQSQQHQWVSVAAASHQSGATCDFCTKQLVANKPALHCENCGATVHQSQGCKDQLTLECVKQKQHSSKSGSKSVSGTPAATNNAKRGSTSSLPPPLSTNSGREISNKKTATGYSPWRRVATKLGVNQTINEERDGDSTGHHREAPSNWEEHEFGEESHQFNVGDLEGLDPELGLGKEEPDSWTAAVGRNVARGLVNSCEREVKRQEHIYEFVLTEKHHCLVLLAMERIFADGLRRHFGLPPTDLERMFPRLRDLTDIHLKFLLKLRRRQQSNSVVPTIADILIEQFSGGNATSMKSAYGDFCSRHREAVNAYKYYYRSEPRFVRFVRHCQANPLLKKKGIPECILFVTQRLTKYPLLVEPLIKTGVASHEVEDLRQALLLVKQILGDVDAQVADKERADRKLEIYHRIEAKSFATHRGMKFKKSDVLGSNRTLKFEGTAFLMQGRSKMAPVVVVVLSDVLFFLAETRDQKYAFFAPDNKAGVVSLQKLLVREKAGQESRGIYLISSNPSDPEMFELKVQKPKDKQLWIQAIRAAVETCPQDLENENDELGNNGENEHRDNRSSSVSTISAEERQRIVDAKQSHIRDIVDELRKKDVEQAALLEEKMGLQLRLRSATGVWNTNESDNERESREDRELPDCSKLVPDYKRLVHADIGLVWSEAVVAVQKAMRLASSLSFSTGSATLSRSLSSAGERHSEAYVPPALCVPRRAETFAGFDHNKERSPWRDNTTLNSVIPPMKIGNLLSELGEGKEDEEADTETDGNRDQQLAAVQLSHYVYRLFCIVAIQMTTINSLQAQLAAWKDGSGKSTNNRPNPNRQLEELRNLQDQLSREKAAWRASTQQERTELDEQRAQLSRLRDQLTAEQRDVTQQRDQLYRRLEALERQGVSLVTPAATGAAPAHGSQSTDTLPSRKSQDNKRIPLNLISATNQQKVQSSLPPVKQQLPLKLASGSNNNNSSSSIIANNSPDRHSRAGSSPAIVTSSSFSSPDLSSSNSFSNINTNTQTRLRATRSPPEQPHHHHHNQQQQSQQSQQQQHQQQRTEQPLEEEVIFF